MKIPSEIKSILTESLINEKNPEKPKTNSSKKKAINEKNSDLSQISMESKIRHLDDQLKKLQTLYTQEQIRSGNSQKTNEGNQGERKEEMENLLNGKNFSLQNQKISMLTKNINLISNQMENLNASLALEKNPLELTEQYLKQTTKFPPLREIYGDQVSRLIKI